jgi:hypothetical protein
VTALHLLEGSTPLFVDSGQEATRDRLALVPYECISLNTANVQQISKMVERLEFSGY